MKDRALALARACCRPCGWCRQMAQTGQAESRPLAACMDGLFRFDARRRPEAVFDGADKLEAGPPAHWYAQLEGGAQAGTPALTRMAMTVLHLERRFMRQPGAADAVHSGAGGDGPPHAHWGPAHPRRAGPAGRAVRQGTSARSGRGCWCRATRSTWAEPDLVGEVPRRAAGGHPRRGAVAPSCGGSCWDFLFGRRALAQAARDMAASRRAERAKALAFQGVDRGLTRRPCAPPLRPPLFLPGACP